MWMNQKSRPVLHLRTIWRRDSLDQIELVMALLEAYGFEISDADVEKISTVQDAIEYVEKHAKVSK